MIDVVKLKQLISEGGYSQRRLALAIGLSPQAFYRKMKRGVFLSNELLAMAELLQIQNPSAIFFASFVAC